MADDAITRFKLKDSLELELPDGSVVEVRPGPYRKGIAVVPRGDGHDEQVTQGRGRKPRPGTIKLRQKLARDAKADNIREPTFYYRWILKEDETISQAVARQVVYRELRSIED